MMAIKSLFGTESLFGLPGAIDCDTRYAVDEGTHECQDVDKCALGTDDCTGETVSVNLKGGFDCNIPVLCDENRPTGYTGFPCVDIEQCLLGIDDCWDGTTCVNIAGRFTCDAETCSRFTREKGGVCVEINECDNGVQATEEHDLYCGSGGGYFTLDCGSHPTICMEVGGGDSSTELNECALGLDDRGPGATCFDTAEAFACRSIEEHCDDEDGGYERDENGTRVDIDECAESNHDCAARTACFNTIEDFTFDNCPFFTREEGGTYVDISECDEGKDV